MTIQARAWLVLPLFLLSGPRFASAYNPWRFLTPHPQGGTFHAAWAAAENRVFFGGDGGMIFLWDGITWTQMVSPTTKTINAIHGTSPTDVWAVGGDSYTSNSMERCVTMHYDGNSWSLRTPPEFSGWTYPLTSVCALAPNDVWGTIHGGPTLAHWNGSAWGFVNIPAALDGEFYDLASAGPNHLFAVGTHGQIVHRNGENWTVEQKTETGTFTVNILVSAWAGDLDHVYAAGNYGQVYRRGSDGVWSDMPHQFPSYLGEGIVDVVGSSPGSLYFLGIDRIRWFDGGSTVIGSSPRARGTWETGACWGNRVYLAGTGGAVHEYVGDNQGGGVLSSLSTGESPLFYRNSLGAVRFGNGIVNFAGWTAGSGSDEVGLVYFNGGQAMVFPVMPGDMTYQEGYCRVLAALGGDENELTIAWTDAFYRGHVNRWDGTSWHALGDAWNQPAARALWRSPSGTLYALTGTNLQKYQEPGWEIVLPWETVGGDYELSALWGRTDNEIYVGTDGGRILRYNGSKWTEETTPSTNGVVGFGGTASDTYAVGKNASAWRRSGTSWSPLPGIQGYDGDHFLSIVTAPDGVYASLQTSTQWIGGGKGYLWKFLGNTAAPILSGISRGFESLIVMPDGSLVGFGALDYIMTNAPRPSSLTLQRVDLASEAWTSLGSSGISLRAEPSSPGSPVLAALPLNVGPLLFGMTNPDAGVPGRQQWFIGRDSEIDFPGMMVRFTYDEGALSPNFPIRRSALYRHTGREWVKVPCTVDTVAKTFTARAPSGLSTWTFAAGEMPEDLNEDGTVDRLDLLMLVRYLQTNDARADLTGDGAENCTDLWAFVNAWEGE